MTKHADFYYRALLWGHYNKRCKTEIPRHHQLSQYSLTGAGTKHRSHPLPVAIALDQLRQLRAHLSTKHKAVSYLEDRLRDFDFLELPTSKLPESEIVQPAWYSYVLRFKKEKTPAGLIREGLLQALQKRGVKGVDIPTSIGVLCKEPLFTNPAGILTHLYHDRGGFDHGEESDFTEAESFYDQAIKLSVPRKELDLPQWGRIVDTIRETINDFCK